MKTSKTVKPEGRRPILYGAIAGPAKPDTTYEEILRVSPWPVVSEDRVNHVRLKPDTTYEKSSVSPWPVVSEDWFNKVRLPPSRAERASASLAGAFGGGGPDTTYSLQVAGAENRSRTRVRRRALIPRTAGRSREAAPDVWTRNGGRVVRSQVAEPRRAVLSR
jgi:hypothetical protein